MEKIRSIVPAGARLTWYAVASAVITALVSWGVLSEEAAPAVTGVVIAVVTLVFAIVHSTTPWRQALYAVAASVAVLGAYLGWGSGVQMDALLAVIAPVLGITTAAATTNAGEYVGEHRAGE
nr:hypothetical protein [Corynebacterium lactis]